MSPIQVTAEVANRRIADCTKAIQGRLSEILALDQAISLGETNPHVLCEIGNGLNSLGCAMRTIQDNWTSVSNPAFLKSQLAMIDVRNLSPWIASALGWPKFLEGLKVS